MTTICVSAFLLGVMHAAGPDHIVAVTTLAAEKGPRRAARIGSLWGLGHAAGAAVLVSLIVLGARYFSIETGAAIAERGIGVVLILLGARTLLPLVARRISARSHEHDGAPHTHFSPGPHRHDHGNGEASSFGLLHGLAGGPHLLAAAPVALLSAKDALLYLGCFSAGTIAAMTTFAYFWGAWISRRQAVGMNAMRWSTGFASTAVGVWWLAV